MRLSCRVCGHQLLRLLLVWALRLLWQKVLRCVHHRLLQVCLLAPCCCGGLRGVTVEKQGPQQLQQQWRLLFLRRCCLCWPGLLLWQQRRLAAAVSWADRGLLLLLGGDLLLLACALGLVKWPQVQHG
jgi:hypothetical protein